MVWRVPLLENFGILFLEMLHFGCILLLSVVTIGAIPSSLPLNTPLFHA